MCNGRWLGMIRGQMISQVWQEARL